MGFLNAGDILFLDCSVVHNTDVHLINNPGRQSFLYIRNISKLFLKLINLFLFSYNCLHFLPFHPPYTSQSHLPPLPLPSPLILSLCPLWQLLQTPLSTVPSPLPYDYCYNVLNFKVSGSILKSIILTIEDTVETIIMICMPL